MANLILFELTLSVLLICPIFFVLRRTISCLSFKTQETKKHIQAYKHIKLPFTNINKWPDRHAWDGNSRSWFHWGSLHGEPPRKRKDVGTWMDAQDSPRLPEVNYNVKLKATSGFQKKTDKKNKLVSPNEIQNFVKSKHPMHSNFYHVSSPNHIPPSLPPLQLIHLSHLRENPWNQTSAEFLKANPL